MSRNLSSAYHALLEASLTTGASDTVAFKLNCICHFRNISGAIWEEKISMANEEIAILFKVNLVNLVSFTAKYTTSFVTTEGRTSSPNSYPHITLRTKVLNLEMFYKAF